MQTAEPLDRLLSGVLLAPNSQGVVGTEGVLICANNVLGCDRRLLAWCLSTQRASNAAR
jgi:hypothetical protein